MDIDPDQGKHLVVRERNDVLNRIADVSERDLDEAVATGTQFIEPLMITLMGIMIGGVAIALLLPIFSMSNAMAG